MKFVTGSTSTPIPIAATHPHYPLLLAAGYHSLVSSSATTKTFNIN